MSTTARDLIFSILSSHAVLSICCATFAVIVIALAFLRLVLILFLADKLKKAKLWGLILSR